MSFRPFLAYSASAGSGKTFALSARYISLLFMGESPRNILAATFTNKAASEMRLRVIQSLKGFAKEENSAFADAVMEQTGLDRATLLARQPEVLERFLRSGNYIMTLDSFFSSILRSASLELGLEPDFVAREKGFDEVEGSFLREVQGHHALMKLVRAAVEIEDKRLTKILDVMQSFYRVDPLLPRTEQRKFTLRGVEEEIEALRLQMIEALAEAGSAPRCIKLFESKNTKDLFGKELFGYQRLQDHSWFAKSANETLEMIFVHLKEALLSWAEIKESVVLESLFGLYTDYKNATIGHAKSTGVLSFDDLTYFTYRLLHESISRDFLYFKIDTRFQHILLDEFQDTSTLQFLLLRPLIDEIFSGIGQSDFKSFFYVGDTKQSLYRFRGGVEELFDKVAEGYGVEILQMETNYRSARGIVEQVNEWFEAMPGYLPQKARENASSGHVEVLESESVIEEALTQVKRLIDARINPDDITFLVATNKDGIALQEACAIEGIDAILQTSSSLSSLPKIAALVSMVSYLYRHERVDAQALLERAGRKYEELDLAWFSPFMQPVALLDHLVREFGFFEGDLNILKLLEFAAKFANIPAFLEEFARSSIPVANHTIHGAKIMTIHGSKGLEFERVIVVDKITGKKSDAAPILYRFDEMLHIDRIFYRISKRENFDLPYKNVLSARKRFEEKDRLNMLYVALTRAAESLIVIKKPKDSIFEAIKIAPCARGELQNRDEHQQKKELQPKEKVIVPSHYGRQEVAKDIQKGDAKDKESILFGTGLHYLLEMMGAFEQRSLDEAMEALRNRYGQLLSQKKRSDIYYRAKSLIEDETFKKLLNDARISKEQGISFGGEIKKIDLLLEYPQSALVVDYKSSKKYQERHIEQVAGYQEAIAKITGKRTEGAIIYLLEDTIEFYNLNQNEIN